MKNYFINILYDFEQKIAVTYWAIRIVAKLMGYNKI